MAKVTIADIAREAQVSVTTVSRFINGNYGKMSQATRARIQETVDRLEYRPSASARRMRQQSTHVVGVIVADISNVFSSLLFSGIYAQLQPAGYDVMLMNANNSATQEHDEINRLLSQEVDGLIVQPNAREFAAYEPIISSRTPLVMVDRECADQPDGVAKVVADNEESCRRMGLTLADMGYDNIVVLSRTRSEISAQAARVSGFAKAVEERHVLMVPIEADSHDQDWLEQRIRTTLDHLNGRTVLVSLMGPLLFDILAALKTLGIRFPNDVGLVSFDDWRWSQYVQDGIYLLEQDPQALGREAARNLLAQITARGEDRSGDPYAESRQITLPVTVVEANSITAR
ncbi:LacI family DNA-binding transcriptional regulator [Bifidobacterium callimiconis]|uniref:LacI family DNA-binding transcriptional regulator n=1 Tax=Bifidobacterium callimiconis TaxID=2306973 RepID=UPI001BDBBB4E|nr:LacI family DNA-binding transcriptional regulator [Bifidobacterium callimiconis]MBT1177581.1 LacI family DNA-binding transcriptional regulator [Bifidobacterium callimiconis]